MLDRNEPHTLPFYRATKVRAPKHHEGSLGLLLLIAGAIGLSAGEGLGVDVAHARPPRALAVTDFGAKGDGLTDDYAALQAALDTAASIPAATLRFAAGKYRISRPLSFEGNRLVLEGHDAILDCRHRGTTADNGQGGGLTLRGDDNRITGLRFEGWEVQRGSLEVASGRLLRVVGSRNIIATCHFQGGNGGAIDLARDHNRVQACTFERCNNHSEGGDYGAIHLRAGRGNQVVDNEMCGQAYSGISAYGNGVVDVLIRGNHIQGDPSERAKSMGLYFLAGANQHLTIEDNTFTDIGNEGIVIFSRPDHPTRAVRIARNVFARYDYAAIFLNQSRDEGTADHIIIQDNLLEPSGAKYHIVCEQTRDSLVGGNVLQGPAGSRGTGLLLQGGSCSGNLVQGNLVVGLERGICFVGDRSACAGNILVACATGIDYARCDKSWLSGNLLLRCSHPLAAGQGSAGALVADEGFAGTAGAREPEGSVPHDLGAEIGAAWITARLSAGSATIPLSDMAQDERFIPIPLGIEQPPPGSSLKVTAIDRIRRLVEVRSQLQGDHRAFVLFRTRSRERS